MDEPLWALMDDTCADRMCSTTPVQPHYGPCRWHPHPHPMSPSPTPPRMPTHPTSVYLPLFEWGNTAMDIVLPTDPAVTRHPPTIPMPTLSDVQHLLWHRNVPNSSRTAPLQPPPLSPPSPPNIDLSRPTQDAHIPQVHASPTL
ncbi:hypothetical protein IW262DRAFT_1454301 [Armillaria fumosa]|nr:hypothetical protein IW262DRAFT_1454301 [Armillaria fumosa]